jgi:hypothetical protein
VGSVIIVFLSLFPQTEIVSQTAIDTTITGWYFSEKFRAESGYWLDLDISSTGASVLHVVGQIVGEVFRVEGSTYKYTVPISGDDVYQVQVENKAGHFEFFTWVPHENHIIGNFYLKKSQKISINCCRLG